MRLTLVQYPGLSSRTTLSPPCAKVHMALRLKGLEYDVIDLHAPWQARRYNPRGRLPVLRIDGETIVDSSDILSAIDRRHPTPPLEPAGVEDAARGKVLEDWADEVLYFYAVYLRWCVPESFARMRREVLRRLPLPMRWIAPWIARREIRARTRGQGVGLKERAVVEREFAECLAALGQLLESRPWLAGERISRADLAVCAVLDQLCLRQLTPAVADAIEARPELVAWIDRVHQRAPGAA